MFRKKMLVAVVVGVGVVFVSFEFPSKVAVYVTYIKEKLTQISNCSSNFGVMNSRRLLITIKCNFGYR